MMLNIIRRRTSPINLSCFLSSASYDNKTFASYPTEVNIIIISMRPCCHNGFAFRRSLKWLMYSFNRPTVKLTSTSAQRTGRQVVTNCCSYIKVFPLHQTWKTVSFSRRHQIKKNTTLKEKCQETQTTVGQVGKKMGDGD